MGALASGYEFSVSVSLIGCGRVRQQRRILIVSRRDGLLTAGQRESLERDGYLLVPSLLDETVLTPMRARLDELVYQALVAWDANPGQAVEERGVVDAALGLSDPDFAPCREHPLLAEAAAAILPGPADARAVAEPVGHVVHQRLHSRERAAAGHPGFAPGGPLTR